MKKTILAVALACLSTQASADFAGIYVGGGGWDADPSGTIRFNGDDIDLKNDLNLKSETQTTGWITLEHPVPALPNLRLRYTDSAFSGSGTISRGITFGGTTFLVGENINTDVDLNQTDLTLYYELLDNWLNLDLGVNFKYFDGSVKLATDSRRESEDVTGVVPMLYAKFRLDVPMSGIYLAGEGHGIDVNGNHVLDYEAKVGYHWSLGVGAKAGMGIEGGWRAQELKLDDNISDVTTDIENSGAFGNIYLSVSMF